MEVGVSEFLLFGLSGGVDSSAAALLARERWPDLPGRALYLDLGWDDPSAESDARAVADRVGVPLDVVRSDIGQFWVDRKYIPMAGMPCPASLKLKAEPAMLWAAEALGGRARWIGSEKSRNARPFDVVEPTTADGLYVLGFLAGEESRGARYRQSWPDELGRPVFPLMEAGKTKDDAYAILRRHGISIDYGGLPRRSCQPCIHWSDKEREVLAHTRPDHVERVAAVEAQIGRTFDRRGALNVIQPKAPETARQEGFSFIDGACGAWCK